MESPFFLSLLLISLLLSSLSPFSLLRVSNYTKYDCNTVVTNNETNNDQPCNCQFALGLNSETQPAV